MNDFKSNLSHSAISERIVYIEATLCKVGYNKFHYALFEMDICVIVNNVQINEARTIFFDGTL